MQVRFQLERKGRGQARLVERGDSPGSVWNGPDPEIQKKLNAKVKVNFESRLPPFDLLNDVNAKIISRRSHGSAYISHDSVSVISVRRSFRQE